MIKDRQGDKTLIDVEVSVDEYLSQIDWRVNANANQGYSLGGLILNVSGKVIANYWLNHVYPPEIGEAHRAGDLHIHDLDMLSGYCAGWSLRSLLTEGFNGVAGKVEAKPAKHLSSAVGQMVNFLGTLQNEWAGAQSFSVHPKETIVLKDKFNNIQIRRIGEFCDFFIEKNGGQQINGISIVNIKEEGFKTLSFNQDGVAEWKPVTKAIRHNVTDPLHILKTNKGMLCVSKNHSVFSLDKHIYVGPQSKKILALFVVKEEITSTELKSKADQMNVRSPIKLIEGLHSKKLIDSKRVRDENGKVLFAIYCANFHNGLVLKKTKELMPEKEVKTKKTDVSNVATLSHVELEQRDEIDLYQVIKENDDLRKNTAIFVDDPDQFKAQVTSLRAVSLGMEKSHSYLHSTLKTGEFVPFDIYEEYQGDYAGKIQIGKKRGGDKYPRFLRGKQLENIIKLIAWYLSEGNATSTGVGIAQFDEGFVEEIKYLLDELNAVYFISRNKNHPKKRSFLIGGYLGFFIKTLGGKYADNKQIPSFVFNVSRNNKEKFFRELIKGDGYKRDKGLAYVSTSNLLITGLNLILLDLGYRTSIKTRFEENFEEKVVGFSNSSNNGEKLTRYDLIIHQNNDAVWPHNDFESAIIHENVAFNSKAVYEYDLSVEDNESFVGGVGLFALHNSTVDTYLAPFVRKDNLSYREVKQCIQELIYNLNVPSRWGCVPLDTEILTKEGWKLKDEISTSDKIYGFQNGNIIDDEILAINEYDFDGELIAFSNRSQEQLLTPNHRVLRLGYNDNKEKFFVDEAEALFEAKSPLNVPVAGHINQDDYAISDDLIRQKALQEELQINILRKCSERQIKLFIETCIQKDGKSFVTKDNNIKDGLQELAALVGYEAEVVEYRSSDNILHHIIVFTKDSAKVTLTSKKKLNYKGKVWCPTTGSSYWIARRKGSVFITGNSQTPFTNLTFDWVCPEDLRDQIPYVGGEEMPFSYGDLQAEMDMINRAFIEVMTEGDAKGRIFTFPIPTYNITSDFPWSSHNTDLLFSMTARFGVPYFQNFINSELKPNMVRSMCCRLRLDLTELLKRGNGLFGSAEQTGCYDDETEVFTNNGWKFFKDVTDTDLVLSMDMGNCVPEFVNIDSYYEYDYNGDLIHFKSLRVDLLVTPNHRMIYKDRHHGVQVKTAQQIQQYKTFDIPNNRPINRTKTEAFFVLPELRIRNRFYPEVRIPYELWAEFMGFYLSDGSCEKNETSDKTKPYLIFISQTKEDFKKDIERILDQLPFAYSKFDNGYQLDNKPLCLYLRQFGCHNEKFIPPDLKEQSGEVLASLWNALIKGDGHKHKVETYWTTSLRLVEDLREILIYMGFNSSCKIQKKKDTFIRERLIPKENKKDCFAITKITKSCNSVMAYRTTTVPYQGKVYCLGVKHGSLLVRRKGHINWCGNSLGVVTINCARLGYQYQNDETSLYQRLDTLLELGKNSLEIKRKVIQQHMDNGLFPFTKRYLGTLRNHFSTLGVNGINEMIRNLTHDQHDITTEWGQAFAMRLLEHIRARMVEFQEETGHLYNLEATPAEGTTYRFAKEDKKRYPDIIQAGTPDRPYYTNSSQLPVGLTDDPFEALELQDELQTKYTGGCIEKGNKVITDKGAIKIEEIVNHFKSLSPIKALSYNPKTGQSEWDLITEAVTIDVAKHHKIKVVAERGVEITTSDWHPFFVMEKITFSHHCPLCAKPLKNVKAFAAHLRYSRACRDDYSKLAKYQIVEKRADELNKGDYILQNAQNLLPEKSQLNSELAYLIGFFIGDGSISEFKDNRSGNNLTRYKVRFFSEAKPTLNKIAQILNRFFDCQVKPIQNDKRTDKLFEVVTSKKSVLDFLFQYHFFAGKKVYTITIPSEVKHHLSKENFYSFIAGLIDSDGQVGKRDGTIEYCTVSEELADDIVEMCTIAGVLVSKHKKITKINNEVDMYRLSISASQATLLKEKLPLQRAKDAIKEVLSDRLKRQLPVVRVLNTSKVEVQDNDFYDLTTQHNHNYLAGNNSFVFVHNTVLHLYMTERISSTQACKNLVRRVLENYRIPYITVTPTFSICPVHGYLAGEQEFCPLCDEEMLTQKRQEGVLDD